MRVDRVHRKRWELRGWYPLGKTAWAELMLEVRKNLKQRVLSLRGLWDLLTPHPHPAPHCMLILFLPLG